MTVILGLELTNITCCYSSESDDKTIRSTVSMAAVLSISFEVDVPTGKVGGSLLLNDLLMVKC